MFDYKETADRLIRQEVESGAAAGACALVFHKDEEIYFGAYGYADKEEGRPMQRDTICRLYSLTKPVTAAAIMILAERGDLDLRDPVSLYLPEFAGQSVWTDSGSLVPACRDNTIWDMLCMVSGVTYPDPNTEPGRRMQNVFDELIGRRKTGERVDTREYMRRIAGVPLSFQPGTKWKYGLSADILGGVAEAVSGKRYGEFLKEELFEPLGMKDTGFYVPQAKRERFAQIYEWKKEAGALVPFTGCSLGEYYGEDVAFESGGAGLVSTIDDYGKFARMMMCGGTLGGQRILGQKTVEFMTLDRLSPQQKVDYNWDSSQGYGYGCLMRVLTDTGRHGCLGSVGEFGWDGWPGTYAAIDPKEGVTVLYFIQRCGAGTTQTARKIKMATYGAM